MFYMQSVLRALIVIPKIPGFDPFLAYFQQKGDLWTIFWEVWAISWDWGFESFLFHFSQGDIFFWRFFF